MKKYFSRLFTLVILSVSATTAIYMLFARLFRLTEAPIYDEVYSLITATPSYSVGFIWKEILLKDVNLPLFNFILYIWAHIVPFTITWMRLLPAFFSFIAPFLAWKYAPKKWPSLQKFTLCCLLGGSVIATAFSSVLRAYPLGICGTLLFSLLALELAHRFQTHTQIPRKLWIGFFGIGFLTAWLHYFGAAIFFTTALWLFFYACYYKQSRATVFWTTALAFAGWIPWVINTYLSLDHFQQDWWHQRPLLPSSWDAWVAILGRPEIGLGILLFVIIGLVSFCFTHKKALFSQTDLTLPVFQLGVLIALIWAISHRYNLWMDRYFLIAIPCLFIFLSALFTHLQQRHKFFLILLPLLLISWMLTYWDKHLPLSKDPSGLRDSFEWIAQKTDKILVIIDPITYPQAAQLPVLNYYLPKDKPLKIIPLTMENSVLIDGPEKEMYVLPLCSFVSLMKYTEKYKLEIPDTEKIIVFEETCIVNPHE